MPAQRVSMNRRFQVLLILAPWLLGTPAVAAEESPAASTAEAGHATFLRTTIVGRLADLEPSIVFWRDVMGYTYAGEPRARTAEPMDYLGITGEATWYYTTFQSRDGAMIGLVLVEDQPGFPALDLPETGVAYGSVVLLHRATNLRAVWERALEQDVEIIMPYGPSPSGRSMQIIVRAPTGHVVELFEMKEEPASTGTGAD